MTIIESVRRGEIPEAVARCAAAENRDPRELARDVAEGYSVIPRNRLRSFTPLAVGRKLRTKVNANVGTSTDHADMEEEKEKLRTAIEAGTDSVMDLSTGGDLDRVREALIEDCPVMFGTVPLYQVWADTIRAGKDIHAITPDAMFAVIEKQARQGVDYMTVHCGVTRRTLDVLASAGRVGGMVSKGGALMAAWIRNHRAENPLYARFDRLLDIAAAYDVTLSLGDGLRPGAIADAGDRAEVAELELLGELKERALARGVQVMIEGPGHVPLHLVEEEVRRQKRLCGGAPFYVLGPLVCDVAPGYDHITSAIGGALAAAAGADFLCYVTPSEHLRLPTVEDVRSGVIASRIAAHAGDIAKGIPGAAEYDRVFSTHRQRLDWEKMYERAIDPEAARLYRARSENFERDTCTMCGDLCALKIQQKS